MFWIERCADGSYLHQGVEYPLPAEAIEQLDAYEIDNSGNEGVRIVYPFELETKHGCFKWDFVIIEYVEQDAASFVGFEITDFPAGVRLKDELELRLQDGWRD